MTCMRCGAEEAHFVPPSLGEPGFFICERQAPMTASLAPAAREGLVARLRARYENALPASGETTWIRLADFGALLAALTAAEQERAAAVDQHRALWVKNIQAEARVAKLEAALRAVEWVTRYGHDAYCPWCGGEKAFPGGHTIDCPRQAALSAPGQPDAGPSEGEEER
jgi:hypothetical protein